MYTELPPLDCFQWNNIVLLIEVIKPLLFLTFCCSAALLLHVRPTWITVGVEGWHGVSEFHLVSMCEGEYPQANGVAIDL